MENKEVNEELSDEELEGVAGGISKEEVDAWAEKMLGSGKELTSLMNIVKRMRYL